MSTNPHLTSSKIAAPHCFTTRYGGVSAGAFSSLNFACGSGETADDWANVMENHRIIAETVFKRDPSYICRSNQTHSANVAVVDMSHAGTGLFRESFREGTDGLVTAEKSLILSVRMADCVPVLLHDPKAQIIGALHSGWRGTAGQAPEAVVAAMKSLGTSPENITAAIGPAIGQCCYEVGDELYSAFENYHEFFVKRGERYLLDLSGIVEKMLAESGLLPENVDNLRNCTYCDHRFFSHRRNGAVRGTMGAFIML